MAGNAGAAALLYLSYDGMTDALGQSQVLPYLVGLSARGHRIALVSLEKPELQARFGAQVEATCRKSGINWHPLRYRRRPPILSAMLNIHGLRRAAEKLCRRAQFDFIHARSDLAGIAALALKRRHGFPFLYDMRAFWPDERAEGGAWDQNKPLYRAIFRYFKARQRELLAEADHVVTLADGGRDALLEMGHDEQRAPVTVIPCCADFEHFRPPSLDERARRRAELGLRGDEPLMVHLGSIGCNSLLGEMLDFFLAFREQNPGARFLFVAPDPPEAILGEARVKGLAGDVLVRRAARDEVPGLLGAADVGIFFVRPVPSKRAALPTKLGEMVAVGLPVVANSSVGDVASILAETGAGATVDQFTAEAYEQAIAQIDALQLSRDEIRERARHRLDVEIGIERYESIYSRLAAMDSTKISGESRE